MSKKTSKYGTIQVNKKLLARFKSMAKPRGFGIGFLVESFMQNWMAQQENKP